MSRFFRRNAVVSPTSPAALLAMSLTDPETRDEWARSYRGLIGAHATIYHNKRRDLEVSRLVYFSLYSSGLRLTTPFTLNDAEQRIVRDALRAFDKHLSDERERAALARLIAKEKGK